MTNDNVPHYMVLNKIDKPEIIAECAERWHMYLGAAQVALATKQQADAFLAEYISYEKIIRSLYKIPEDKRITINFASGEIRTEIPMLSMAKPEDVVP